MSKSKEELNELKKEVEAVSEKLQELTEEEIAQVCGGSYRPQFYFRTTDATGSVTHFLGELR